MSQVPEQKADAAAFGFCDVSQEFREGIAFGGSLRELRRSAWPRRVLNARHGLGRVKSFQFCPRRGIKSDFRHLAPGDRSKFQSITQ